MEENKNEEYDSTKKRMDDTAENIENEAKNTANEFKEGWNQATNSGDNKKLIAGILAIVLGSLGIHKFILGYNKEGIILLVASLIGYATSCLGVGFFILMATGIVGLIEGIIYLTKSDEEFYNMYQEGEKPWF
jgi:TM2 domain-containing membrane protein YozV|tara:strand:- start:91267 stop:91665 length:399 start_codon:yes stop_codon:yes gene_type:complete